MRIRSLCGNLKHEGPFWPPHAEDTAQTVDRYVDWVVRARGWGQAEQALNRDHDRIRGVGFRKIWILVEPELLYNPPQHRTRLNNARLALGERNPRISLRRTGSNFVFQYPQIRRIKQDLDPSRVDGPHYPEACHSKGEARETAKGDESGRAPQHA
ncbi:hypothetical protein GCM10008965_02480 [Methylorubrum aminovorans]